MTGHELGPSTAQRSKLLPPALLETFYFSPNHEKSSCIVCLAGYLGLIPMLRKMKQYFPFLYYYFVFCEVHLDLSTPHISGKLSWEYSSRIRGISTWFWLHEGPQDIELEMETWASFVLNPSTTFLIPDSAWSGNLPLLSNSSFPSGPPHIAGILLTLVDLQGGSRGQARDFAADPRESSTSKENVIYTTSPGKWTPRLNGGQNTLGLSSSYF